MTSNAPQIKICKSNRLSLTQSNAANAVTPDGSTWQSLRQYVALLLTLQGRRLPLMLGLNVVSSLFSGVTILLLVPFLDLVNGAQDSSSGLSRIFGKAIRSSGVTPTLEIILAVFVVLFAAKGLLEWWTTLLNSRVQHNVTLQLQRRLLEAVAFCRWSHFLTARQSEFLHALTSDVKRVSSGCTTLQSLVAATMLVCVQIAVSISISPMFSLLTLSAAGGLWPLWAKLNRSSIRLGQRQTGGGKELYHSIEQLLSGMKEIKSHGGESWHVEAVHSANEEVKNSQLIFQKLNATTTMLIGIGSVVFLSVMLLVAVRGFQIPAVELLVLAYVFSRLIPRLRRVQSAYQQILNTLPAFHSMMTLQAACEAEKEFGISSDEHRIEKSTQAGGRDRPKTTSESEWNGTNHPEENSVCIHRGPEVTFRAVSFRYRNDAPVWALKDIDISIRPNQTTAIIGHSGAGKSTLADVLMGLLLPECGHLEVDGQPLTEDMLRGWRKKIGYVPQDTFLLHETIRRNLLMACPEASDAELNQALELAGADGFVARLSEGLDTIVGDRGVRLSGGERQRLALARALLRQPDLLILDEATSHLDAENQNRIQESIQRMRGQLTVIIIAHRLSTIRHADQIIGLMDGKIVEFGSYQKLNQLPDGLLNSLIAADRRDGLVA
tara:strand:- start:31268 stop:33259 length:1992 start_codon:yes stop_codon:yes gene_type:complete